MYSLVQYHHGWQHFIEIVFQGPFFTTSSLLVIEQATIRFLTTVFDRFQARVWLNILLQGKWMPVSKLWQCRQQMTTNSIVENESDLGLASFPWKTEWGICQTINI